MSDSTALLAEIDVFLIEKGMAATTFGLKALNNTKLIRRLRDGGSVSLETAAKIRTFMQSHRAAVRPQNKSVSA